MGIGIIEMEDKLILEGEFSFWEPDYGAPYVEIGNDGLTDIIADWLDIGSVGKSGIKIRVTIERIE